MVFGSSGYGLGVGDFGLGVSGLGSEYGIFVME